MKLLVAVSLAALAAWPASARAQLVPNDRWYTIETDHFRVHFAKGLEGEGKRAAVNAERAWAELATELKAPSGRVDLVIADNIDYVNGYASSFPSNRVVVFAHPPIDAPELRNYDDWSRLVITHELTHIFHLDRADGLWRFGRDIFGRHPALFPNAYLPSWIVEGLAVYYESRITGAGRLEGSEHYMIARAAAEVKRVPGIGEWSRATSRFPGGESVYSYGSLLLDYLARTRGPEKIPQFVDRTSRVIWPLSLNAKAKGVFGISFENAWRDWRDSLQRVSKHSDPLPWWRELTHDGRYVTNPRWVGDSALLYTASNGKETAGAYRVTLDGRVTRVARRNGLEPNVPMPDGSIYFTQPDYIDAFHYRNDLYVERNGQATQLTHGARVTQIDVSRRGEVVAVQSVPGTTRLVLISSDGTAITPLTAATYDVQWAEPRWSTIGNQISAVRIVKGGNSELVLLDGKTGAFMQLLVSEAAIISSPSWRPDGNRLVYTSTRTGVPQAYTVLTGASQDFAPLTSTSTGFFSPEIAPNSRWLAGLDFRYDGYHLGFGESPSPGYAIAGTGVVHERASCTNCSIRPGIKAPLSIENVPRAHRYSPWRSLAPTYWEPAIGGSTGNGTTIGAATSGYDIIGRHSFYAQAMYNTKFHDAEGYAAYRYAGLGQPYIDFSVEQTRDHFNLFGGNVKVGDLSRRVRLAGINATFSRPRARTFASFSIGGDIQSRDYSSDPDSLLPKIPSEVLSNGSFPSIFASASWNNTKRPFLSISREDGVAISATVRDRWRRGEVTNSSKSVLGVGTAYKSLDLPGFAHHVLAIRGAGGYAESNGISTFSVGGVSSGSLDVVTGISIGGERRNFPVRGFSASSEQGARALGGTAEYRFPIAAPSRRVPFIPVLFDRISGAAFADAGRAYCPSSSGVTVICRPGIESPWLASVGGEMDFDTAVQYDVPVRFRLGIARPVSGRDAVSAPSWTVYLAAGAAF
jgi:hypothetical protein